MGSLIALPAPVAIPTVNPAFGDVALPSVAERWRYIQLDRAPFDSIQPYTTATSQTLWWYDPRFGQFVYLGEISNGFLSRRRGNYKGVSNT